VPLPRHPCLHGNLRRNVNKLVNTDGTANNPVPWYLDLQSFAVFSFQLSLTT